MSHLCPPIVLTIAGSDPSSGAGIQADIKTFSYHNVYGLNVITSIISQAPGVVKSLFPIPSNILKDQLFVLANNFFISAIKIGVVYSIDQIEIISDFISKYSNVPCIVDPVFKSSSGSYLIENKEIKSFKENILSKSYLITPNIHEAEFILKTKINKNNISSIPKILYEELGSNVLLKGGHYNQSIDVIIDYSYLNKEYLEFSHKRVDCNDVHGTGCVLSSSITSNLANKISLKESIELAIKYIEKCLENRIIINDKKINMELIKH